MIRTIIADDHGIFRQGLAMLLAKMPKIELVGQAADGLTAEQLIMETRPDLAVLDVSMPKQDGLEVIRKVKGRGLQVKCILLTMHNEAQMAARALACGADGFLLKESVFEDFKETVREVMNGTTYLSPELAADMIRSQTAMEQDDLTRREREVLTCIASGMTNQQIGKQLFISTKTVDTHRFRIMKKLDLHTVAELVRYAIKTGLIDP